MLLKLAQRLRVVTLNDALFFGFCNTVFTIFADKADGMNLPQISTDNPIIIIAEISKPFCG